MFCWLDKILLGSGGEEGEVRNDENKFCTQRHSFQKRNRLRISDVNQVVAVFDLWKKVQSHQIDKLWYLCGWEIIFKLESDEGTSLLK